MKLTIAKECDGSIVVEEKGRAYVGRGQTIIEAVGSFFHQNQYDLDIEFEVDPSALPAETARRRRELAKR